MKTVSLCILTILCFVMQGCGAIYYLDRQDRIPHESEKGYIKFFSAFDSDSREGLKPPGYVVKKEENGYVLKIIDLGLPMESIPISDRIGEQKYIILYPDHVACRLNDGFKGKTEAEKVAMEEFEINDPFPLLSSMEWSRSSSFFPKEFLVTIEQNMVTPVGLNSFFTFEQEKRLVIREKDGNLRKTEHTVKIYSGTLKVKTGYPSSIAVVPEEEVLFSGPRIYDVAPSDVFASALEAAGSLGWEVKETDEEHGHLLVEIPRMLEQNKVSFDVGIFAVESGKTIVDLSSHSGWQRWGSYNMALSREKMYKFYKTLDGLISAR